MEILIGVLVVTAAGFFAYMSGHLVEESKRGKSIPLPWEQKEEEDWDMLPDVEDLEKIVKRELDKLEIKE
tara:strand:+ start:117 stop:326 length:210 start_codon:yes stop_codon:yes gene_type:complete